LINKQSGRGVKRWFLVPSRPRIKGSHECIRAKRIILVNIGGRGLFDERGERQDSKQQRKEEVVSGGSGDGGEGGE